MGINKIEDVVRFNIFRLIKKNVIEKIIGLKEEGEFEVVEEKFEVEGEKLQVEGGELQVGEEDLLVRFLVEGELPGQAVWTAGDLKRLTSFLSLADVKGYFENKKHIVFTGFSLDDLQTFCSCLTQDDSLQADDDFLVDVLNRYKSLVISFFKASRREMLRDGRKNMPRYLNILIKQLTNLGEFNLCDGEISWDATDERNIYRNIYDKSMVHRDESYESLINGLSECFSSEIPFDGDEFHRTLRLLADNVQLTGDCHNRFNCIYSHVQHELDGEHELVEGYVEKLESLYCSDRGGDIDTFIENTQRIDKVLQKIELNIASIIENIKVEILRFNILGLNQQELSGNFLEKYTESDDELIPLTERMDASDYLIFENKYERAVQVAIDERKTLSGESNNSPLSITFAPSPFVEEEKEEKGSSQSGTLFTLSGNGRDQVGLPDIENQCGNN